MLSKKKLKIKKAIWYTYCVHEDKLSAQLRHSFTKSVHAGGDGDDKKFRFPYSEL